MKKLILLSLAFCGTLPLFADLNGDGYYRVQNLVTNRYVSVVDNRGSVDYVTTSADLQAITLNSNFEVVCSDPASVLYVQKVGSEYNISAQGTSIDKIIDHYVHLEQNGSSQGQKLYMAYGTYDGVTRYLGDGNVMAGDIGGMSVTTTGNYRKWYIKPVVADGDNYFGAAPTVNASAGDYAGLYSTLYTSFPYSAYSDGVKFYTIDQIGDWGQVTIKEVTGVIPAATPVIVKCVGEKASDNRINVGGTASTVDTNSSLKGVYFNCDKGGHINRVAYDANTMRVLGVCEDGSLGFITYPLSYIPANTIYLTVPAGSPAEFKVVEQSAFSGVSEVSNGDELKTVYTLTGIKVGDKMTAAELRSLPSGIYIVNGKKIAL